MDSYERFIAEHEETCAQCGYERSRRRGVVIARRFYCADCYAETQPSAQSALAERCALTDADADVDRFAAEHALLTPSPVKYVAIPALGRGHSVPRVPTLRRAEAPRA